MQEQYQQEDVTLVGTLKALAAIAFFGTIMLIATDLTGRHVRELTNAWRRSAAKSLDGATRHAA